ncbi:MAG: diguanylate cyclase [Spirochaetia bacterium]
MKANAENYKQYIESIPEPIILIDENAVIFDFNQAAQEESIIKMNDLGKPFTQTFIHVTHHEFLIPFEKARTGKKNIPFGWTGKNNGIATHYSGKMSFLSSKLYGTNGVMLVIQSLDTNRDPGQLKELAEYRFIATNATDLISRYSPQGVFTYLSPACESLFGYKPEELLGTSGYEIIHKKDIDKMRAAHKQLIQRPGSYIFNYRAVKKDGAVIWVESSCRAVTSPETGKAEEIIAVSRNITLRKMIELEREAFFDYSIDMLCVAGFDGYFKRVNPSWEKTLGWDENTLLTSPWLSFVHPEDKEATIRTGKSLLTGEPIQGFENRFLCKDGTYKWISWNSYSLTEKQLIYGVARDVTRQKELENTLKMLATQDGLTGINNRRHFIDLATSEMTRQKRYNHNIVMLMLDLDHFKDVNDKYGHGAGDQVLQDFVASTQENLREHDIFGRLGGEEFAIVCIDCGCKEGWEIGERIRKSIEELHVDYNDTRISFTVSIGAALWNEEDTVEALLQKADKALYEAKAKGRNMVTCSAS